MFNFAFVSLLGQGPLKTVTNHLKGPTALRNNDDDDDLKKARNPRGREPRLKQSENSLAPLAPVLRPRGALKKVEVKPVPQSKVVTEGSRIPRASFPKPRAVEVCLDKAAKDLEVGYSSSILPEGVEDIDKEDGGNIMLATDFVNDIYGYLRQLEVGLVE